METEASGVGGKGAPAAVEDEWVDRVVPENLDWRQWIRDYPIASIGAVAVVGYIVGRYQGDRLMDVAKDAVRRQLDDSLSRYTGFVRTVDDEPGATGED